jgi:hypothetical protein
VNNAQDLHPFIASDTYTLSWHLIAAGQSKSQDAEATLLKHSVKKSNRFLSP